MQTFSLKSRYDDLDLAVAFLPAKGEARGTVQLVHGMCEHKERYYALMEFLAGNGFNCIIHDHRGNGTSVKTPDDLGFMYKGGWQAMVEDVKDICRWAQNRWGCGNYTLLGHSMGSMVVRSFIKRYDSMIDKLIVCGSPSYDSGAPLGLFMAKTIGRIKGDHHRPLILNALSFGSYNKRFKKEGYPNAWVCSNEGVLKSYHADPLCQFIYTANGFENLLGLMKDCYSKADWVMKNPNMRILFISGAEDPCRISDKKHSESVNLIRSLGYRNVMSILYGAMRHEILNETDKQMVWDKVLEMATLPPVKTR